jgi:gluconolactonase
MNMTRRDALAGAAIVAASTAARTAHGAWEPNERYPDPAVKILDPSFRKYRLNIAGMERLATGMRWSEGPIWFGDGRYLLSEVPSAIVCS